MEIRLLPIVKYKRIIMPESILASIIIGFYPKNLSSKYGQKRLDTIKMSATYALKAPSKRVLQKAAEAQKTSSKSTASTTPAQTDEAPMEIQRGKYIPLELGQ